MMYLKNDCQSDCIKEAFDKLYNCVMPYIDLKQLADAGTAFKELDKKVHSEIYILKKCLSERDKAVDAGLTRSEVDRERISDLEKKIHELEEENANLRVPPRDIFKRPWHGDGNATTGGRTCCESLTAAIEFQNKKIEELEAEKTRLKEAYDIQETTIKRLKLLLGKEHEEKEVQTGDHEFEFGDKVFVPWSYGPYMYIKRGLMYNPRTERLVYVGKTEHLKWFGERFEIV